MAAVGLTLSLVTACGDDKKSDSTSTTAQASGDSTSASTQTSEESGKYEIVPDKEVTTGLKDTIVALGEATASSDPAAEWEKVHELWEGYEGTVKKNDQDSYLAFEDALSAWKSAAESKDTAKMTKAVADFTTTSGAYLVKFPGLS